MIVEKSKYKIYSDQEREILYQAARLCDAQRLEDMCEDLLDMIYESENASILKSSALGTQIFRLVNSDTLASYVGLQRLLEAGMMIEPEKTIGIMNKYDEIAIAD